MKMPDWKGMPLRTYGEVMKAMDSCKTKEEAQGFMKHFRQHDSNATENIGYLTGYFDAERATQMREWFQAVHPIFGNTNPTPEEAFKKGLEIGQKAQS